MRFCYILLLLLVTSNTFAQKIIPYNEKIEEKLWMEARGLPDLSSTEENDEIWKQVFIRDLTSNQFVEPDALSMTYGIFTFHDPLTSPTTYHIMIKYHDCLVIIKDDSSEEILAEQSEFLINFFAEHKDIPRSYFPIFLKHLINVYEENRIYLE